MLKNALIPLITVLGPQIPNLATGSIFIEATFRIPGLGRYFVTSTLNRDYPMIMATMLLVAILWSVTYLISDILYTIADPRVRLTGGRYRMTTATWPLEIVASAQRTARCGATPFAASRGIAWRWSAWSSLRSSS